VFGAAAFRTAEQVAVEAARGGEIVDGKGEMEGRKGHALCLRGTVEIVEPFLSR
jgi:hypothetical protein